MTGPGAVLDCCSSDAVAPADVPALVLGLPVGRVSLMAGIGPVGLHRALDAFDGEPRAAALFIDIAPAPTAQALVESAIAALAGAALRMWPLWYGSENFADLDGSTLSQAALRIRVDGLRARLADLSVGWAMAAMRDARHGEIPRRAASGQASEVAQLCLALGRPIIVTERAGSAVTEPDAYVAAMEWLARTAAVPVLVLCGKVPASTPPFDRWACRVIASGAAGIAPPDDEAGRAAAWLSPVAGQPHPFSDIEKKLARWLRDDAELGPLFAFNRTVRSPQGRCHKVDLLWETGRIVVEIDGYADHSTRPRFRDDRHRDYELLTAGYRVLRITNDEVEDDCGRVVEKIRDVVRAPK